MPPRSPEMGQIRKMSLKDAVSYLGDGIFFYFEVQQGFCFVSEDIYEHDQSQKHVIAQISNLVGSENYDYMSIDRGVVSLRADSDKKTVDIAKLSEELGSVFVGPLESFKSLLRIR